jgi:hypothetical protein
MRRFVGRTTTMAVSSRSAPMGADAIFAAPMLWGCVLSQREMNADASWAERQGPERTERRYAHRRTQILQTRETSWRGPATSQTPVAQNPLDLLPSH